MSTARKRTKASRTTTGAASRKAAAKSAPRKTAQAARKGVKPAERTRAAAADIAGDVRGEAMPFTQEQLGRASSALFRGYDEVAGFNKGNVEAVMLSGSIVARGVEEIGKAWLDLGQHSLQRSVAIAQALVGARTVQELIELQSNLARATLDRLLAEGVRISELSAKVANEAVAPLQARVDSAFSLVKRRAAA